MTTVSYSTDSSGVTTATYTPLYAMEVPYQIWDTMSANNATILILEEGYNNFKANRIQNSGITSITIPASMTTIHYNAFGSTYDLTSIHVHPSNPNFSTVDGVLYNKDQTIMLHYPLGKPDTTFNIPSTVEVIGQHFAQVMSWVPSLQSLNIPSGITNIMDGSLNRLTNLTSFSVAADNANYSSADGILFNKTGTKLLRYPIGKSATTYTIPSTVTTIGDGSFVFTQNLTSITIPNGVERIEPAAFFQAHNLSSITIPPSVEYIGTNAFYQAPLTSLTFEPGSQLHTIGLNTFKTHRLTSLVIPAKVSTMGYQAFEQDEDHKTLTSVEFEAGSVLSSLENNIFNNTLLSSIIIPASVTTIVGTPFPGTLNIIEFEQNSQLSSINASALSTTIVQKIIADQNIIDSMGWTRSKTTTPPTLNTIAGKSGITVRLHPVPPPITVIGDSTMEIFQDETAGATYTDQGATATNDADNDISSSITVSGDVVNIAVNGTYTITYSVTDILTDLSSTATRTVEVVPVPTCFPAGTPVQTDQGVTAIDQLIPGEHTLRGKSIFAITQTRPLQKHIVCFEKDSIGKNVPSQQTLCSKEHKVLYQGEMIKARDLVDMCKNVKKVSYNGEGLYNVLLEKHGKMLVNNMICETLHPENIAAKFAKSKNSPSKRAIA